MAKLIIRGGNHLEGTMVQNEIQSVEFITVNTDKQAINRSRATHKIVIGEKITHGQGAGSMEI